MSHARTTLDHRLPIIKRKETHHSCHLECAGHDTSCSEPSRAGVGSQDGQEAGTDTQVELTEDPKHLNQLLTNAAQCLTSEFLLQQGMGALSILSYTETLDKTHAAS